MIGSIFNVIMMTECEEHYSVFTTAPGKHLQICRCEFIPLPLITIETGL